MSKIVNNKSILKSLKRSGVKIYGNDILISSEAVIESGATLFSPCTILGKTRICSGAKLHPNCYLDGAYVGKDVCVYSSTIVHSKINDGSVVGPYAHLRENAIVGKNCRIGDFVEVKRSTVGDNSKAAHLSYIGDAVLGRNVNIGCGVVFANFDGKRKSSTTVESDCFIGCNCNIIAPSRIRKGAYIAAATTVCGEVCAGSLCVGRCKPKIIEGGASGRYRNG